MLAIPPRKMWGWGPNVSGYCGSMSIQTVALYFGNYLSQDKVRGATGGHDASHEIMLGRSRCCSAFSIMQIFSLNATQFPYWSVARPQHGRFVEWLHAAVANGDPVAFGLFMKTESNANFDHIVPLVGFDEAGRIVFNDLHANVSLHEDLSTFVANRDACRAPLPWTERWSYCLPKDVNFGVRVHGNADMNRELLTARLVMDDWSEPDYSTEDAKHEAPARLGATLIADTLRPHAPYALLQFSDPSRVPNRNFLANATGGVAARVDFHANASGAFAQRVRFLSNETIFFRVVRRVGAIDSTDSAHPGHSHSHSPFSWRFV